MGEKDAEARLINCLPLLLEQAKMSARRLHAAVSPAVAPNERPLRAHAAEARMKLLMPIAVLPAVLCFGGMSSSAPAQAASSGVWHPVAQTADAYPPAASRF